MMVSERELLAMAAETEYTEMKQPSLGTALQFYRDEWDENDFLMERESLLRMLFLTWYSGAEPLFLTGLPGDTVTAELFGELFRLWLVDSPEDAELLFVVGTLATLDPAALDRNYDWHEIGTELLRVSKELRPAGFVPDDFRGRGALGAYVSHMLED